MQHFSRGGGIQRRVGEWEGAETGKMEGYEEGVGVGGEEGTTSVGEWEGVENGESEGEALGRCKVEAGVSWVGEGEERSVGEAVGTPRQRNPLHSPQHISSLLHGSPTTLQGALGSTHSSTHLQFLRRAPPWLVQ